MKIISINIGGSGRVSEGQARVRTVLGSMEAGAKTEVEEEVEKERGRKQGGRKGSGCDIGGHRREFVFFLHVGACT